MGQTSRAFNIPTITIGGRVFTDLANLIYLAGDISSNARCSLRAPNASAGYQVTTGKTLKIVAVEAQSNGASAWSCTLAYSDNDVGIASTTAFTNPVYHIGSASTPVIVAPPSSSVGAKIGQAVKFDVPAEKYPGALYVANSGYVNVWGYEV